MLFCGGAIMGGINCHQTNCHAASEETMDYIEKLRLDYATIVENVFTLNSEFSQANIAVEQIMNIEQTDNQFAAFNKYDEVKQHLLKSLNVIVSLNNRIDLYINSISDLAENGEIDFSDEEFNALDQLQAKNSEAENLVSSLNQRYTDMPFNELLDEGGIHEYLRNTVITPLTENIVSIMADELLTLKEYSLVTSESFVKN